MYKNYTENIEIYFICDEGEEMNLVETYYDQELDIHYWYFNAYLAYKYWKEKFKGMKIGTLSKDLLIVAASRYLLYSLENKYYKSKNEYKLYLKDIDKINKALKIIEKRNAYLKNL